MKGFISHSLRWIPLLVPLCTLVLLGMGCDSPGGSSSRTHVALDTLPATETAKPAPGGGPENLPKVAAPTKTAAPVPGGSKEDLPKVAAPTKTAAPVPGGSKEDLPKVAALTEKNYTEVIPGTEVKIDMVAIPGGTYLMGSPESEKGRSADEGPQHPVTLSPLWMAKTEITWEQFDPYWKNNPGSKQEQMEAERRKASEKEIDALSRPTPPYADETFGYGRGGMPALSMTHHAAMDYCRWLSEKTKKVYRLPTEAEWEWACRAGSKTPYSCGDEPKELAQYAWFGGNSNDQPQKVGKKKPNAWGLHDMHGNVLEWCLDQYDKDYYSKCPLEKALFEPVILPGPDRYSHVARGGSWADKATQLRSAARRGSNKNWSKQDPQIPRSLWWLTDADFLGFRIVCGVDDPENLKKVRPKTRWDSP
jgi:formylglycine-generating enzyme required for sulfatase activity